MGLTPFYQFQHLAQEHHVVLYYDGYFSQAIVTAMGDALRQRLDQGSSTNPLRRKLFSVFVELAQNIVHYSAEHLTHAHATDQEMRRGAVWIGEHGGRYFVVCANPVLLNARDRIIRKLDPLRSMTVEEIRQAYRDALHGDAAPESKGAGLGFLTIARDATEPIEFEFVEEDGTDTLMFYLKATI